MKTASILLVMVALITAMTGCESTPGFGQPIPYVLNIFCTAGGSVTVTVNGEEAVIGPGETEIISDIPAGTDVELAATAAEGYEFVEWLGESIDGVTSAATVLDMQDDCEITAVFQELTPVPTYELTMAVSPLDSATTTDETNTGPYPEGAIVSIKAVANMGYEFVNWTAPVGVFDDVNTAETTFTMPGQNVTITANFEAVPL
jgi:predicted small secreted protein